MQYEPNIVLAWLQIALTDYENEFIKVYDYINCFDK